eukprot:3357709-Rhodomonas_salina.3
MVDTGDRALAVMRCNPKCLHGCRPYLWSKMGSQAQVANHSRLLSKSTVERVCQTVVQDGH